MKEHMVGAWSAIAVNNVLQDGRVTQSYGPNPTGSLMLDANGRFSMTLIRSDLPSSRPTIATWGLQRKTRPSCKAPSQILGSIHQRVRPHVADAC